MLEGQVHRIVPTNTPNRAAARAGLLADALECLSFNLHYRALRVADIAAPQEPAPRAALRHGLCRVLMYNVTLRKLILQGTALRGLVRDAGHALALNAQPLLSRLDMSGCGLTEADTRGLQAGLARAWYGGSVACESLAVACNPDVPLTAWDKLWSMLVDPASWSHWPTASPPPPPPRLVNMRHLDVRGTTAAGLGFARLLRALRGLQSLELGGSGPGVDACLAALAQCDAPLRSFVVAELRSPKLSRALHAHAGTLERVLLHAS